MATVLQIARRANVSWENVVRVLNSESVSTDVAARVNEAIDVLGAPSWPQRGNTNSALPARVNGGDSAREFLLEALAQAKSDLASGPTGDVGSVVVEAVRVEVRPVAARMTAFFEELIDELAEVRRDGEAERRERLEDIGLLVELITAGWRGVDRRLGRIEKMLDRLEAARQLDGNGSSAVRRPG